MSVNQGWRDAVRVIPADEEINDVLDRVNGALVRDSAFLGADELAATLEGCLSEFSVTITVGPDSYEVDLAPRSAEGHDFQYTVRKSTGEIDRGSLVVGEVEPEPEDWDE